MIRVSKLLDEIRQAIEASDKSRYRLSKETGIDEGQLSKLMSGTKGLSYEALERLAEALGLEIVVRKKRKDR
jgi:transcriptional regulator with XRE-family HTH domain